MGILIVRKDNRIICNNRIDYVLFFVVFWERFDFIGAKVHGNKPIGMCYETASSLIKMQ